MKRSLRVLLALVLVLSLCLGLVPTNAYAANGKFVFFNFNYTKADGTASSDIMVDQDNNGYVKPPAIPDDCPYKTDGSELVGWTSSATGSRTDFERMSFELANGIKFTAVWKHPDETDWVHVVFESGFDGVSAPPSTWIKKGETVPKYYNYRPTHPGFRWTENWFTKSELEAIKPGFDYEKDWELVEDKEGEYRIFNHKPQEDVTYVLKWIKTWDVTFIDGEKEFARTYADNNKYISSKEWKDRKLPEFPSREGYQLSWYYMNGDEKVEFALDKTVVTKDMVDESGNLNVYSDWKEVKTVNYYNYYPNYDQGRVHGKPYTVTYTETDDAGVPKTFTLPEYKDTGFTAPLGYIFIGWRLIDRDPSVASSSEGGSTSVVKSEEVALKAAKAGPEAEKADIKEIEKADITAVDKIDVTEKDNIDVSEKEKEETYKVYQPGDEVELSSQVYVIPEWKHVNTVTYYTNYLSVYGDGRMEDDEEFVTDEFEETVESFTVKTFEDAFGADQPLPLGYKFVGWVMHFSDQDIEKEPAEGTVIGPGWSSEVGNQDARKSAATDTAVKEAVKETIPEAALKEEKEALPATTAEKETAQEKEQAEALDTPPAEADPAEPVADKVDEEAEIVNPGDTKDMHLHVYLDAVYEPCFKVVYHRVDPDSDFAKEKKEEDTDPYTEEYTTAQYKDAEGKFDVLSFEKTGLEGIDGYEFDYWTMTWLDPEPSKEPAEPRPFNPDLPIVVPERPIEVIDAKDYIEVEAKDYREYVKSDATVLKAAKAAGDTAEVKESADAITAVTAAEKEKIDASEASELEPFDLTDKEAVEDEKDEEKEPEKINPGDKKELHAEVHLFANWKAKVYNAKWVDEDGKTVLHGPVDFTVEEGQPKDTDYNKLSGNEDPTKAEDDENTYEFSGWKEEVDEDGNVTYTAQYDPTPKPITHNATWVDEDGETELNKETFKDGEDAPKADSFTAPEKEGKEFDHWDEEKVKDEDGKETGDVIYTAVYKPIDVPNTGDMARPELWIVAGILSMLGFVLLARKRREEE